jgi:hypothetical protein
MIKKLIAPLQKVLMQKKFCPACTRSLSKGKLMGTKGNFDLLACECGRIFVLDHETETYRRALNEDLRKIN